MDVGTPIRELEVIPEHKPVPVKHPDKQPSAPAPTPREKTPSNEEKEVVVRNTRNLG